MKKILASLVLLFSVSSFANTLECNNVELKSLFDEESTIKGDIVVSFTSRQGVEASIEGTKVDKDEEDENYSFKNTNCVVKNKNRSYKDKTTSVIRTVSCWTPDSERVVSNQVFKLVLKESNMLANITLNESDDLYNSSSPGVKVRCNYVN